MKLVFIIVMAMALAGLASAYNPPHYSQRDPRWGNHKLGFASYTIGQQGCFLTCQTSMIASQGIKVNGQIPDPDSLNTWYKSNGGFLNGGGMLNYKAPEKFGFKYEKMTSQSSAVAAFNQGKFVLCHVEHLSHWVLVTSVDSNGYQVMDPADVKTSYKFSEVPEYAVYTAPAGYPGTSSSAADEAEEPTPEPVSTPVPESTSGPQPTGFNPPVYRQGDSKWGSKQLGFGSYTIARKGCFLTAQTSMIASQGITVNGQIPDPGNMNEYFKDNDEFDGGMLLYKAPEEFGFTYEGKSSSRSSAVDAFNEGKFVLLHVENLSHWVLVTSITSSGYEVMDPADVRTSYKFSEVPEIAIYTAPAGKPGTA